MHRDTFVKLSVVLFGLVLVSFIILGFSRIVLPYRTARMLAAPTMLIAGLLAIVLFVQAILATTGVRDFE